MTKKPTRVWVLPEEGPPRRMTDEELQEAFEKYPDTGFEPKLDFLYKTIECDTIDVRDLPDFGHLWLDDNGLILERKLSPVATLLYNAVYASQQPIVGHAVLVVYPHVPEGHDEQVLKGAYEHYRRLKEQYN
jgi:hypothetical protein